MDDDFIRKLEEVWNKVKEILKDLWEKLKIFAKKLFATNPKPIPQIRVWPKIIKCIGQPISGYASRARTRTRNSC